jgi:hypothetical protein
MPPLAPAAAFPLKGNPQQANYMIIDRRRFLTKSGAIAVGLLANSVVAQSSRRYPAFASHQIPRAAKSFPTAIAFH